MQFTTVLSIFTTIFAAGVFAAPAPAPAPAGLNVDAANTTIKCHDTQEYANYMNCFNANAAAWCSDFTGSNSGDAYAVCLSQWQTLCARQAGCDVIH